MSEWVTMPVEPTAEMLWQGFPLRSDEDARKDYAKLLAAAPRPADEYDEYAGVDTAGLRASVHSEPLSLAPADPCEVCGHVHARHDECYPPADELARCVWTEDENGPWETGCGRTWEFFEDGPSENGAAFCLYCGKPIEEKLFDYASLAAQEKEESDE